MSKVHFWIISVAILTSIAMAIIVERRLYQKKHPEPALLDISARLATGSAPLYRGNTTTPFTLIEFADYQCPACRDTDIAIQQHLPQYKEKVKFVFRNFPLPQHKYAMLASIAAEYAKTQGKFWPMHDALFSLQGRIDETSIRSLLMQMHLPDYFSDARLINLVKERVEEDVRDAGQLGVNFTPSLFFCDPQGHVYRLANLYQIDDLIK